MTRARIGSSMKDIEVQMLHAWDFNAINLKLSPRVYRELERRANGRIVQWRGLPVVVCLPDNHQTGFEFSPVWVKPSPNPA